MPLDVETRLEDAQAVENRILEQIVRDAFTTEGKDSHNYKCSKRSYIQWCKKDVEKYTTTKSDVFVRRPNDAPVITSPPDEYFNNRCGGLIDKFSSVLTKVQKEFSPYSFPKLKETIEECQKEKEASLKDPDVHLHYKKAFNAQRRYFLLQEFAKNNPGILS